MDVIGASTIKNTFNCLKYSYVCITVFIKNESFKFRYGVYFNLFTFYQLSNGINGFLVFNNVLLHVSFVFLSCLVPNICPLVDYSCSVAAILDFNIT